MTLTLLHKRIKFAENMSIDGDIGVYHTQF